MAPSKVSLKLLIDNKVQRVLFAEAGKDFVDFLFSIMSLPIGTVIRLLNKEDKVGCLANLYQSIEDLNDDFMQPNLPKDTLLKPESSISFVSPQVPLLPLGECSSPPTVATTFRKCDRCNESVLYGDSDACLRCRFLLKTTVTHYVPEPEEAKTTGVALAADAKGGFVKSLVTYMVTDDLVVAPMETISSITLRNKLNIKEPDALEEKIVDIGMDQGLEILKNALASNTVLTNVFLRVADWDGPSDHVTLYDLYEYLLCNPYVLSW